MPSRRRWVLLGSLCAAPLAGQRLDPVQRAALAAEVWSAAQYNSPSWDRVRSAWDSAFTDLLATAATRQTDVHYFRRLRRFVALLHDAQAVVEPPTRVAARLARPPLVLRGVERRPFLVDYSENDEMRVARPQRDAEIVAVQGVPAEQWLRDSILPEIPGSTEATRWEGAIAHMLEGPTGTAVHLELRLPGGERRGASVTRSVSLDDRWPLTPPPLRVDTLPDGVVWVRLSSFADRGVAKTFDRAFPAFDGVRGVILDLRDHTGADGSREIGYAILARLVAQPLITPRRRMRQFRPDLRGGDNGEAASGWISEGPDTIAARHDLPVFTGPVAVLASTRTRGAAEEFLIVFRNAGRGPIVGQRSAGSTGAIAEFPLRDGWRLRLSVTREEFPDGTAIDGSGVAPELPVEERIDDFLAGRDAVLERARAYVSDRQTGG